MTMRHQITPGRIITADELQARGLTPKIILSNDFGIAAIKYERTISPNVAKELAGLNDWALDCLHSKVIHYDADKDPDSPPNTTSSKFRIESGIPPLTQNLVQTTLAEIVETTNCRTGRARIYVGPADFPAHIDEKPMANLQLSSTFSMVGYSFKAGTINIIDADYVDRSQLTKHIESGNAVADTLEPGAFYIFNGLFVHESNPNIPTGTRPVRAMMFLNPRTYM